MLIDFSMAGMSGAEVARREETTRPTLPILFVTGYADRAALDGVSQAHRQTVRRHGVARKGAHGLGAASTGQGRAPQTFLNPGTNPFVTRYQQLSALKMSARAQRGAFAGAGCVHQMVG